MYRGFWLWGARSVVFYGGLSLLGVVLLTKLRSRVGPLKKDRHVRGGRGREVGGAGCDECIEDSGFGDPICRVLEGYEALGGRPSYRALIPGGSAKERPSRACGEGEGERGSWI